MYTLLYQQMLVNNHKALSIKTLIPFLHAVNSKEAQDSIILQATRAIYDAGKSGIANATPDFSTSTIYNEAKELAHKFK